MSYILYCLYVAMAKGKNVTTNEKVEVKKDEFTTIVCMRTGVVQNVETEHAEKLLEQGVYITMEEAEEKEKGEMRKQSDGTVIYWWEIHRNPIVIAKWKDWKPVLVNG